MKSLKLSFANFRCFSLNLNRNFIKEYELKIGVDPSKLKEIIEKTVDEMLGGESRKINQLTNEINDIWKPENVIEERLVTLSKIL